MKIGVIGTIGGWSSEKLADAVASATGEERLLIEMSDVRLDMPSGKAYFKDQEISSLDGLIVKKIGAWYSPDLLDRLEVLRYLNEKGMKIFSNPMSIMRVLDRLSCTITLQSGGIPMPATTVTESVDQALVALEEYGEAVVKPLYSTKARGMFILKKGPNARAELEDYRKEHTTLYVQKTIKLDDRDLGIVFLGGKYLTTYSRCKTNDSWNTTTASGGKYRPFDPPKEIIELADKAQSLFNLDFTCVDVAMTDDGPFIFEVSAFGGFRGIAETSGMDAAKLYAEYAINQIKG